MAESWEYPEGSLGLCLGEVGVRLQEWGDELEECPLVVVEQVVH